MLILKNVVKCIKKYIQVFKIFLWILLLYQILIVNNLNVESTS
jgi:hypothetical protein